MRQLASDAPLEGLGRRQLGALVLDPGQERDVDVLDVLVQGAGGPADDSSTSDLAQRVAQIRASHGRELVRRNVVGSGSRNAWRNASHSASGMIS